MRKTDILTIGFCLIFVGCRDSASENKAIVQDYFDIKGYFTSEITRLKKESPTLEKQVEVNGTKETKELKITDWKKELSSFVDADINKPAWKGLFTTSELQDRTVYVSNDEKVAVKKLSVFFNGNQVMGIEIVKKDSNMLYRSIDTLVYYPGKFYKVSKKQNISLLLEKRYQIISKF